MAALGRLAVAVEADIAKFESDMGKADRTARRRAASMQKAFTDAAKVIGAAMGAAAIAGAAMVQRMARDADMMAKVGQRVGMATDELSGLRFAAEQSGVEFNRLVTGMQRMSRQVAEASTGVGRGAEAFSAMGIEVKTASGALRSQGDILRDIATRFATYQDGAAKAALAQEIFGRAGAQMIPLLNQGSDGIQALTDQAERLGIIIDQDAANAAERFNDSLNAIKKAGEGLANQIYEAFIPGLANYAEQLAKGAEQGEAFQEIAEGIADALKIVTVAAVVTANAIQAIVGTILEALDFLRASMEQQRRHMGQLGVEIGAAFIESQGGMTDELRRHVESRRALFVEEENRARQSGVSFGSEFRQSISDVTDAIEALFGPMENAQGAAADAATAFARVPPPVVGTTAALRDNAAAAREAERAMRELDAAIRKGEAIFQQLQQKFDPLNAAIDAYADALSDLAELEDSGAMSADRAAQARAWLTREYRETRAAIEAQITPAQALLESLDEEIRLLRLGNAEREIELALRGATAGMTEQEVAALRAQVRARMDTIEALREMGEATEEANRQQQAMVATISESLADALVNGAKGFRDFGKRMVDMAKRMVAQMIAEFLRLRVIGPLLGGLLGSSSAYAGTGQLAGMFGSSFTGGTGAGLLGMGPMAAGLGGAYYGFTQAGSGGISSLAAGASYGALGLGAAGAMGGFALGAGGAAAGTLGAAGAGATAAFSGAMLIPVIGWILAIAALVDLISGGKLFGTKFRPEEMESMIGIDAEGGYAGATMREVRQRSLFRGRQWRTTDVDPGDEARAAAQEFFENVEGAMASAAASMGIEVIPVIDASIRTITEHDKKGRETSRKIMVDVIGRTWEEATAEAAGTRILAEAILAQVDAAIASDALASALAEPYRRTADELMTFAQAAVQIAGDVRRGSSLIEGSFERNILIIEEMQRGSEGLLETYQRLQVATTALRDSLELAGFELTNSGEEVVRFASALADAAGGAQEASRLWGRYVDAFVDPVERVALSFQRAQSRMGSALEGVGLDPNITAEQFREAFEKAMQGGLSPESMVQWLQAGEAMADFAQAMSPLHQMVSGMRAELDSLGATDYAAILAGIVAETDYNIRMATAMGATEEDLATIRAYGIAQTEALAEAQREAAQEYARFIEDIILATDGVDPTGYRAAMFEIERATADAIKDANRLAQAAGRQGASERELAAIHRWAASQARRAMQDLRDATMSLMEQLGYGRMNAINARIAELEMESEAAMASVAGGFDGAAQAGENVAARWLSAIQRVQEWLDSILLSELSTLTPEQRLMEAQAQFDALIAAALAGDADAAAALPGAATALLQEGRAFWSSTDAYQALFTSVRDAMAAVAAMTGPVNSGFGGGGYSAGGEYTVTIVNPELEALLAERDAMLAQQEAANRLILAQQLTEHLAMLAEALGVPVLEMAANMGISMDQLARDLGIDLMEVNAEVIGQLAAMAAMLGIDLFLLAEAVGVSLGELADSQSLLNDALEAAINALPAEHAAELEPLLRAVEEASSPEEQLDAIAALEEATRGLPLEYRNALAPYLEGVDPLLEDIRTELMAIDDLVDAAQDQILAIESVAAVIRDLTLAIIPAAERTASAAEETVVAVYTGNNEYLDPIRGMIREQNISQGLASYANGTPWIERTGLYTLHRGEAVLTAPEAAYFRNGGGEAANDGDEGLSEALLRRIVSGLERVEDAVFTGTDKVAGAIGDGSDRSNYRAAYGAR